MVQAPPQKALVILGKIVLFFKVESWGDDAKELKRFIYVGRAISLGGRLKFETWIDKNGDRNKYKIRCKINAIFVLW